MPAELLPDLGDVMTVVLKKINSALNNPDYNFYIHTAPMDNSLHDIHKFYAWHIEILPRTTMIGAFDLASGIDVNIADPEEAAKQLREA
jgi:UDPglucose--hexose-1-phosphate uridylyltransferase